MRTANPARGAIGQVARAIIGLAVAAGMAVTLASCARHVPAATGRIRHVMVIDLENEGYSTTFGAASPAAYLNRTLLSRGELIVNYFGTSHVSLGNYIAQVSGQGPTPAINSDCIDLATLGHPPTLGRFTDIAPGTDAADQGANPGQVVGDGCVFPAPTPTTRGARTIGDQLDTPADLASPSPTGPRWREYAEDMGNDTGRDYGDADPMGGADCAHAPVGGVDHSNSAAAGDQYATRHNPFVYFHSVIDDVARCDAHVVPLGTVTAGRNGAPDVFAGHLFQDLRNEATTPAFMFVTPNLCDDGHDATCAGTNTEGGKVGGLAGADLWLRRWMPMIFNSPAYRDGSLLVVLTFDESDTADARACPHADQSTCKPPVGPNMSNYGFSPLLALFKVQTTPARPYVYPGGGQIGAVVFNNRLIKPGSVDSTGAYTHYSALRTYEDLLGIVRGGDDGKGHLGNAARAGVEPFGPDVFNRP